MIKNKSKPIALFVTVLLWGTCTHAQETTNATGGSTTGSGGSVVYSLGQVFYNTSTDSSGSVSQGVQHAYEIYTVGVNETQISISLTLFPNPTAENLTLQISQYQNLSYQLFDMQGKLLSNSPIAAEQTKINMSNLPEATYFVNVVNQENKLVQSFKIIKNQ
jgi:hypothetical protein